MSTFSGLNTAYTALTAARKGLDVVGQNIANATTAGYTRQRVSTSAVGSLAQVGPLSNRVQVGQGVSIDGIARLGNAYLDARVRGTAATSGYLAVRANVMTALESALHEPGANGISAQLQSFWAGWQDVSNHPGEAAPAGVLLEKAGVLAAKIAAGYQDATTQWSNLREQAEGMVAELNDAGARVADLNGRIRSTLAAGGSVNELLDQRNNLTTTIAALTGGTVRLLDDGSAEVLVGGNALVSGDSFRSLKLSGTTQMAGAAGSAVTLEWAHRPGTSAGLSSGEIAGALSMLAPTNGSGTGGAIAETAEKYNKFARELAAQVNAVHTTGATQAGVTGLDFFTIDTAVPAALGLNVVPTDAPGIAAAAAGGGALDGSIADKIAAISKAAGSPDKLWASMVTRIGVDTRSGLQQAVLADLAATSASTAQLSHASVDLDEENVSMLTYQVAYQGAARVMTAVDEMLDTLINRTGLVGR